MEAKEFNGLTLNEKQELVNKHGQHKSIAAGKIHNYLLYNLGNLYIETAYSRRYNRIDSITAYKEDQVDFDKYIDTENKLKDLGK